MRAMAYHNAAAAALDGATVWAAFLLRFQYMGPRRDAWEQEWRIANPAPTYSIPKTPAEAVAKVSPPLGWAIHVNVLKIDRAGIAYLLAGPGGRAALLRELPAEFRDLPIIEE